MYRTLHYITRESMSMHKVLRWTTRLAFVCLCVGLCECISVHACDIFLFRFVAVCMSARLMLSFCLHTVVYPVLSNTNTIFFQCICVPLFLIQYYVGCMATHCACNMLLSKIGYSIFVHALSVLYESKIKSNNPI